MMRELLGAWKMALPSEVPIMIATMSGMGVSSESEANRLRPSANTAAPTTTGMLQPILSDMVPEIGPTMAFTSEYVATMAPATPGAMPMACCR